MKEGATRSGRDEIRGSAQSSPFASKPGQTRVASTTLLGGRDSVMRWTGVRQRAGKWKRALLARGVRRCARAPMEVLGED